MSVLAIICLALVLYTYAGYPLLIRLLGALRRFAPVPPATPASPPPRVSVLIPVWHGSRWLDAKLASVVAQHHPREHLEILIGLDGADDETTLLARRWAEQDARITLHETPSRAGKPATINRLVARARGEVLVLTDVRQPLDAAALGALVTALADPRIGCATGEVHLEGRDSQGLYWRYEQAIRRAESRFRGMVGANGPLLAVRRDEMPTLDETIVSDDLAFPLELARRGLRTTLVPAARVHDVTFDDAAEQVRKIRNLGGNWQLFLRRPRLLVPFLNPIWFETISHKVLRLVVPFALALLAIDSLGALASGPSPWELALAGAQLAAYAFAALAPAAPGRLARAFVMAQLAVLLGLWRFVTGRASVLW